MNENRIGPFIIDIIHQGIIAVDRAGRVTVCNTTAQKMFSLKESIVGKKLTAQIIGLQLNGLLEADQGAVGKRCVINDKTYLVNQMLLTDPYLGQGRIFVVSDISEMEFLTNELETYKTSSQELERLVAHSHDGLILTDGEGTVLWINESIPRVTNLKPEHFVGKYIDSLYTSGCFYTEPIAKLARINKQVTIGITKISTGKEVMVVSNPILDERGQVVRVVSNVRDLSEINYARQQPISLGMQSQNRNNQASPSKLHEELAQNGMVTNDYDMLKTLALTKRVATKDVTVLLQGESGVGKEVFAKLVHFWSKREGPLVKVNCGAIPGQLLESELFGYCSGAFTGASKEGKPGLFELANNGTLFLDEISDLPLELQGKLLRVIQEQEFVRLGGTKVIRVNVRMLAASNQDLMQMVQQRTFRMDLFYRLNVMPIQITTLRDRSSDIPLLVKYFLDKFNQKHGTSKTLAPGMMERLVSYSWPGNVRELMNVIERLVITSESKLLGENTFVTVVKKNQFICAEKGRMLPEPDDDNIPLLKDAVEEIERNILTKALKKYKHSRKVGQVLGISHTAVLNKIKKYNLY